MKRAYFHVMMWKAAAERAPPTAGAYISKFGVEVQDGVVFIPAIHTGSPVPAEVMRELSCGCSAGQSRHVLEERVAARFWNWQPDYD